MGRKKQRVECCGIPLKPKPGLTPISSTLLERSACAPFTKERRMEGINDTSLHRKSGQWGTQYSLPMKGANLRLLRGGVVCHRGRRISRSASPVAIRFVAHLQHQGSSAGYLGVREPGLVEGFAI